jgi:short-subunit dehydrogenase
MDIVTHHARTACPPSVSTALLVDMSSDSHPPADPARPTAVVTGPTAGIGQVFARRLAERGYDLVLVARDRDRLKILADDLATSYGAQSEVLVADLSDRAGMALVEERLRDPDRPVDLLVNNAGFGLKRRFLDNPVDQEQASLDVLVTAVMRLTHAALGPMTARGSGGIINVASVAAYQPRGSYSAAKAWVTTFGTWAAHEYGKQGVRIMTLSPGFTRTEFHARMDVRRESVPRPLWLDVDRVVDEALADWDAGKTLSIPSKRYKLIASLSRHLPTSLLQRFQSLGRR